MKVQIDKSVIERAIEAMFFCANERDDTVCTRSVRELRAALAASPEPDYKVLYEQAAQQYNELAELMSNKTASQAVEPEPVMIYRGRHTIDCGEFGSHDMEMLKLIPAGTKLYTHPAPAKPLSDEQKGDIAMHAAAKFNWLEDYSSAIDFVIEQTETAHGIKETSS